MQRVLVTGANGFVGGHLVSLLADSDQWQPVAASRQKLVFSNMDTCQVSADFTVQDWRAVVEGCDYVVHVAARAHILKEKSRNPQALYHQINVRMTENLVRASLAAGVKRLVFISSAGVHGNKSPCPLTEASPLEPETDYSLSKLEAEDRLVKLLAGTATEYCIIRPPLVYGIGVSANFLSLVKAVDRGIPLPFAKVTNRRSFINVDNLTDFIRLCLTHPRAANEVFLVCDTESLSTPELLGKVAGLLNKPSRLFAFPLSPLAMVSSILGKQAAFEKLTQSFSIQADKAQQMLGWQPPYSMDDGLKKTIVAYKQGGSRD